MPDNIEGGSIQDPEELQPDRPLPGQLSPTPEQLNQPKQESDNMEVHHHSHAHGKKNWKSYGWEFLMLFLAVFCGFLAEYQLEHVIEHNREKQYVESLVEDLKKDQDVIAQHIAEVGTSTLMMDTLVSILNNPAEVTKRTSDLYYLVRLSPRLKPLSTNNRTFEQLKNSGNFRLIRNLATSNKIMEYYEKFPIIRLLESINETEFTEYKKVVAKIFNSTTFLQQEGDHGTILRGTDNPPLRSSNNELLQELSVFAVYIIGTKNGVVTNAEELRSTGAELLTYLKKEYKLD
jgi:hypothetical protein